MRWPVSGAIRRCIGFRLCDDHGALGRYIGGGRGKPAPTVGCLPTTNSYTPPTPLSIIPPPCILVTTDRSPLSCLKTLSYNPTVELNEETCKCSIRSPCATP